MNYIHPSISSKITDNSHTFVTAQGTTKLFAVFTSEKGEDNVIKMITTPSEFLFHYGEPNIEKHGQTSYNIINWLKAGGGVYALRVLPDNAGYSNAIVNIQVKRGQKEVFDKDNQKVVVPNVTLRPTVTYTDVNNTSIESLQNDELMREKFDTLDGFENYLLFAVVPRGRGAGYNDLGFKLTLTNGYDTTYPFRVYNFEVTRLMPNGGMETIEGPFEVALDPDAVTVSGESIFIKNVVETYSNFFNILFNEENYEKLGAIINPNVHPQKIDFFNGKDRVLAHGVKDTYYDEITKMDQHVHFALEEYIGSVPNGHINIIDTSNKIEDSVSDLDNSYRVKKYKESEKSLYRLKESLGKIKKISKTSNPYKELVEKLLPSNADLVNKSLKESQSKLAEIKGLEAKLQALLVPTDIVGEDGEVDPEKEKQQVNLEKEINALLFEINVAKEKIEDTRLKAVECLDYSGIMGSDEVIIEGFSNVEKIDTTLFSIQNYNLKFMDISSQIQQLILKFDDVNFQNIESTQIEFYNELLALTNNVIMILEKSDNKEKVIADQYIKEVKKSYNTLLKAVEELTDVVALPEDIEEYIPVATNSSKELLNQLELAIKATALEVSLERIQNIEPTIENVVNLAVQVLERAVKNSKTIDPEELKKIIQKETTVVENAKQMTYRTHIQNYDRNVRLKYGNDGDLDTDSRAKRKEATDKLLIRGYTGIVDNRLLDKKLLPIDMVLDANYSLSVKNAIVQLCDMRSDFMGILDLGFSATPEQTLQYRREKLPVSNFKVALFSQDFIVSDDEFTGRKMKVTPPYFLASKIPQNDDNFGIHWNFVGPRRGTISGFENLSYSPNPEWKEQLYKAQVNYVEQDINRTKFGSQLTSQTIVSALSNINNVRALLRIQRDVERLMEDYQFEFHDSYTLNSAQLALNGYLSQWVSNRACDSINGSVYASEYDRKQKLLRVKVELTFNSIIERIAIDLVVSE